MSFNRPNLFYEVTSKPKGAALLKAIVDIVNGKHYKQSGIIYALSRKKCEKLAQELVSSGIRAHHYHAGMKPEDKSKVQKKWQEGFYQVIVATIAFGMGIDKADVRFVIHHSIPKSLEGYYQETGRAGRDGLRSGCYLFYGYQDMTALMRMIDEGDGSYEQKQRQRDMLRKVVQYCENRSDCRRVQVLQYFAESFDQKNCQGACDNCTSDSTFITKEFTEYAKKAINLVGEFKKPRKVTLIQCQDIFRGAGQKKTVASNSDLDGYGAGAELDRGEVERLFGRLLAEEALQEISDTNNGGWTVQHLVLGKTAQEFISRGRRLELHVPSSPNGRSAVARAAKPRSRVAAVDFPSTNISSPVHNAMRRRKAVSPRRGNNAHAGSMMVDSDPDDDDYEEDDFEPVRVSTVPRTRRNKDVGPPITIDEKMDNLNSIHQMIVEGFVEEAKKEAQRILVSRGLRTAPFSDTIFREMAIGFPTTEQGLANIPNVDTYQVKQYGKAFLRMIKQAKSHYDEMMLQSEERVQDPNRETVIDLVSDDDDDNDNDDEYGSLDESDLDDGIERRSTYFKPNARVAAFNARITATQAATQANQEMPPPPPAKGARRGKATATRRPQSARDSTDSTGSTSGRGSRYNSRKASSTSSRGRNSAGVKKRATTSKRSSDAGSMSEFVYKDKSKSASRRGGSSRGGGRGGSGGGIGLMPT
ncbi:hypothetical protein AAFC00_006552 [Neodothiora populina]